MKKIFIVFLAIAIPLGIGGGLLIDNFQKKNTEDNEEPKPQIVKKLPSETMLEYKDESGFLFEYPDDVSASASSTLDDSTYADIVFTSKEATGSVTLKVFDTKLKVIDLWLEENDATASGTIQDVILGNLLAKEIKKKDNSIQTGVIDQNILFEVTVLPKTESEYWDVVYKKILETFRFVNPQATQSTESSAPVQSDIIDEGEEEIQ